MRLAAFALCLTLWGGGALARAAPPADNAEMQRIVQADQTDRQAPPGAIDWQAVKTRDEARRLATRRLLDGGALQTAEDFHAAALVFQHGAQDGDALLAHSLAMVAVAKGRSESLRLAAATLDRYLNQQGKPQIYGTQFRRADGAWTQAPYDRELIPDRLRTALGVRTLAEQARQMAELPTLPAPPKTP